MERVPLTVGPGGFSLVGCGLLDPKPSHRREVVVEGTVLWLKGKPKNETKTHHMGSYFWRMPAFKSEGA